MPKMTDEQFELMTNGILALIAMIPQIIELIKGNGGDTTELVARIKKAQADWPEWT